MRISARARALTLYSLWHLGLYSANFSALSHTIRFPPSDSSKMENSVMLAPTSPRQVVFLGFITYVCGQEKNISWHPPPSHKPLNCVEEMTKTLHNK